MSIVESYLFVLGREAKLGFAELKTVLAVVDPTATIQNLPTGVALVHPSQPFNPTRWQERLGGTRLIAGELQTLPILTAEGLHAALPLEIRELALSSPTLSVRERRTVLQGLKRLRPGLRYRENHDAYLASGLSERLLRRSDATEFLIISDPTPGVGCLIAQVVAVQDTRAWTERDRGLPAVDPIVGMLPPKLARIMVNLSEPARRAGISSGVGTDSPEVEEARPILLDPFCGSGQIPIEALRVGWNVIASDLDLHGIERTKQNLTWAQERSAAAAEHTWTAFQSGIVALTEHVAPGSIDALVTEPDLGPPLTARSAVPSSAALDSVAATIGRAFDAGRTLIRPGGRLVIVIPVIAGQRIADRLDDSVHASYTLRDTLHYARPDSRVEREVFVLDRV